MEKIMSNTPITTLSGLNISPTGASEKKITGLYIPQLTTAEIDALDASIVRNGGLVYDSTADELKVYKNNAWRNVTTA
jgi:hypothetical protein